MTRRALKAEQFHARLTRDCADWYLGAPEINILGDELREVFDLLTD